MVIRGQMQLVSFRLTDLVCSLVAFLAARETLLPARNVLQRVLSGYLATPSDILLGLAVPRVPSWPELSWIFVVAMLALNVTLEYGSAPQPIGTRSYRNILFVQLVAIGVAQFAIATIFYALRVPLYSRLFVVSYLAYLFVLTVGYRLIAKALTSRYQQTGVARRRIVVAGRPEGIEAFLSQVTEAGSAQYDIRGCLIVDNATTVPLNIPVLGSVHSLGDLLIHDPIDEVIIVLPNGDLPWLAAALEYCDYFRVSVHIIHEALMGLKLHDLMAPGGIRPFASIMLSPEEDLSSDRLILKRLIDVVISSVALVVLSPLMLLIAIAIKITTPHLPIFYKWHVVGYRGRRFTGYKFTTMSADADERKESLSELNEMTGPVFKIKNDPRVNPLGRFLRKYSLNELPQFWSVLRGDMSLVGPRPAGPHELVRYALWHKRKLSVWPGITCFWQVRGRNAISNFDDWVRMDLEYIQKRSVRTDMAILFETVSAVVRGTGS